MPIGSKRNQGAIVSADDCVTMTQVGMQGKTHRFRDDEAP